MTLFLIGMMAMMPSGPWTTENSGIEEPLGHQQVVVTDGQIFMLDILNMRVLHYNIEKGFEDAIIGSNEGNGQFPQAYKMTLNQGKIYVHEFNGIHSFKLDRTFIQTHNPPSMGGDMERLARGWLVTDKLFGAPARRYTVSYASESLLNFTKVAEWHESIHVKKGPEKEEKVVLTPYNPAQERGFVVVSEDGKWAYIRESESNNILIFDAAKKEITATFSFPDKKHAFDREWGQEAFDTYVYRLSKNPLFEGIKFQAVLPETFPLVKDLFIGPNGNAVVALWNPKANGKAEYLEFDTQGVQIKSNRGADFFERVMKIENDHAFVAYWDNKVGESGVAWLPLSELDGYLKSSTNSMKAP